MRVKGQIVMVTLRTYVTCLALGHRSLLQDNTHFKDHSWIYVPCKFNWANSLTTFCFYHVVFTLLYIITSNVTLAITCDDMVEVLEQHHCE